MHTAIPFYKYLPEMNRFVAVAMDEDTLGQLELICLKETVEECAHRMLDGVPVNRCDGAEIFLVGIGYTAGAAVRKALDSLATGISLNFSWRRGEKPRFEAAWVSMPAIGATFENGGVRKLRVSAQVWIRKCR